MSIFDSNGNVIIIIFRQKKKHIGRYYRFNEEYLYGIKDTKDNIILAPVFDKIDDFENGLAKIYKGDKHKVGYINENGKIVVPCIYDSISKFEEGKAKATKNSRKYIVDLYGNEIEQKNIDISCFVINSIYRGKIVNIVDFGLFIEIDNGTVGLLHVSELKKHKENISSYYRGEEITVQIINIDRKRNRISFTLIYNRK